jgi:4-diphosphocytidyl-2-C-methyl-D-erythritol kinase
MPPSPATCDAAILKALYDLPAPAKLNLFLHVTGRRSDGYHLLQSVFVLIDWCDTVSLDIRPDGRISREDAVHVGEPLPGDDLCTRAARLLQAATGTTQGVHIHLDKRIPSQAGLGGGSSDAATVLLGLLRAWNLTLSLSELEQIGLQLGADVPFFLRGRNAWVSGVGEEITPLTGPAQVPSRRVFVLKPEKGLATPAIFTHSALKRDTPHATIAVFAEKSGHDQFLFGTNDLQPVAELLEPQVSQAIHRLRDQGLEARMTGSGSAVFALLAGDATPELPDLPPGWQQRTCSTLVEHPLVGWAT